MLQRFNKGEILTADKLNKLVEAVNALESRLAVESITDVGPGLMLDQSAAGTVIGRLCSEYFLQRSKKHEIRRQGSPRC